MPFKLSLAADVRDFLRGTSDVEQALDDVADSLDDLARDTKQNADRAADSLEREFTDAFDKVKTEAKTASRKVGDDFKDGTREASEGTDTLKENAESNAKEIAASFDGSVDSIADGFQGLIAEAFEGWGPAGLVAGAAVAAGIGLAVSALQKVADDAAESKDRVLDLADAIGEAGGNPGAVRWAEQLRDTMKQIVDTKEWWEFWQNSPVDKLTDWSRKAQQFGVSMSDVMRAQAGDAAALARVNETLNRSIDDQNEKFRLSTDLQGSQDHKYRQAAEAAGQFRDEVTRGAQEVQDATKWQQEYADATRDLSDAQADAAEAADEFSANLVDSLSVADEGLDDFVKKGKLNLAEWTEELERRARQGRRVQNFQVTIAPKLSEQALTNFQKLPIETQDQIARAFNSGSRKDRKKIVQNLEAEAKVTTTDVDVSEAQNAAKKKPIESPTSVDDTGAVRGAQEAADSAQRVADQERNKIAFKTKVDDYGLQTAVNAAASRITPPTIYVNVKARKEVP